LNYKLSVFINFSKKILFILIICFLFLILSGCTLEILNPKGYIASQEKILILFTVFLMLLLIIPVIIITIIISIYFRESNKKTLYKPNWSHSILIELICWIIPCIIILILSYFTWITTHKLDPFKSLNFQKKPLLIEVVALNWKWLFIYPKQHIATINFLQIPVNIPIKFKITADAPMNGFFIPQLGSQIYAMPGMQTQLNLIANEKGIYKGFSTNYSGIGFSEMKFSVHVSSLKNFENWISQIQKKTFLILDKNQYLQLSKPSIANTVTLYILKNNQLYKDIIKKYTKYKSSNLISNQNL